MFKYLNPIENVSIKIYKKLFESLVKPIYSCIDQKFGIWIFMKKILKGQFRANKSNSNFDFIDSLYTFSAKVYQEYVPFKCNVFERLLYASNNKGLLSLFEILAIYFKTCNFI
jgi:hypothetical protein